MLPNLIANDGFNQMVQGRHGMILYNKNDTVVGQSAAHYGEYFESEVAVFRAIIKPGAHVADIGANIGTHTLAMARLTGPTGWVYAFEPQRIVFQTLCSNVALNSLGHVDCENKAATDVNGPILVEDLDPTTSVNFGGLKLGVSRSNRFVQGITLDHYLDGRRLDFMKADVQGMEESCLRGARDTLKRCATVLYLENDEPEKSASLLSYLFELDYRVYWHLPLFFNPDNFANNPNNIHAVGYYETGAAYLSCNGFAINMVCLPKSTGETVNDLMEVTDINEHPLCRGTNRFHTA